MPIERDRIDSVLNLIKIALDNRAEVGDLGNINYDLLIKFLF